MTKSKKHDEDTPEKVLGTGAAGDPSKPFEGAPVAHEVFEPAPVDAPQHTEKESK